jgi:amidophosphoribosyltransferase
MDAEAHRHINTTSDSELLLNIFADNLQQTGKFRINEDDIFKAIGGLMAQARGAYACVAMLAGFGLIAFRDPNGIRPLGMATRRGAAGADYLFASESVVADASGFTGWEDVRPGEAIIVTRASVSRRQVSAPATFAPDIFEYVYFARPDSVLDGVSVYRSRMAMGDALADEVKRVLAEHKLEVDVVIPVRPSSRCGLPSSDVRLCRYQTPLVSRLSTWPRSCICRTGKASSRIGTSAARSSCPASSKGQSRGARACDVG